MRGERRGAKLDVGTFLIGVEVSLRHSEPVDTEGLFGPLTNGKYDMLCWNCELLYTDLVAHEPLVKTTFAQY